MNRRLLSALLLCLAIASPALAVDSSDQPTPWWFRGLTFHAPFDDPAAPLKLIRGTGALTFTRAHDATHTATYVHPGTGLVTVADNNQLRIEANGALIEGERTNLTKDSEDFSQGTWTQQRLRVVVDNAVSPDGNVTADKIVEDDTASDTHLINNNIAPTGSSSIGSVYAKAGERTQIGFRTGTNTVYFDLSNGTILSGADGTITPVGNGWYRCTVKENPAVNAVFAVYMAVGGSSSYSGDNVSGLYIWGIQNEIGTSVSSYIPTGSTTMTRNKDLLTIPTSGNIADAEGTISAEILLDSAQSGTSRGSILTIGGPNIVGTRLSGSVVTTGDGTTNVDGGTWTYNSVPRKVSVRWDAAVNARGVLLDGGVIGTGAYDGTLLVGDLDIGSGTVGAMFAHIRNLRIWNRAFTDAELQNITR